MLLRRFLHRVGEFFADLEPDGVGHGLDAFDADAGVGSGLIPLDLLLGNAETTLNLDDRFQRVEFGKAACYQVA